VQEPSRSHHVERSTLHLYIVEPRFGVQPHPILQALELESGTHFAEEQLARLWRRRPAPVELGRQHLSARLADPHQLAGSTRPIDSKVLRPMMRWCPSVSCLKRFRSSGRCQGIRLRCPMTPLRATAAMMATREKPVISGRQDARASSRCSKLRHYSGP